MYSIRQVETPVIYIENAGDFYKTVLFYQEILGLPAIMKAVLLFF